MRFLPIKAMPVRGSLLAIMFSSGCRQELVNSLSANQHLNENKPDNAAVPSDSSSKMIWEVM